MAEWIKAAVLKTADPNGSGSSNLSPSAIKREFSVFGFRFPVKGKRATQVEELTKIKGEN